MRFVSFIYLFVFYSFCLEANESVKSWSIDMSNEFISIIESEDKNNLESNLSSFINKNFAINSISMSLIGNLAQKNTKEDLKNYRIAFLKHITNSLYGLANNYENQSISIEKLEEDSNGYLVYSKVEYDNKSYSIVWRVVSINKKNFILDVIIENTSFYVSKKSEFSNILRQNKGDLSKLTEILNSSKNN